MQKAMWLYAVFGILVFGCVGAPRAGETEQQNDSTYVQAIDLRWALTSPAFPPDGAIPSRYSCDGMDVSPPLKIEGVPGGTQSLVLIADDPDAVGVVGQVWTHWVVFDIDPSTREITEGGMRSGMAGRTSSGRTGYEGPCPPPGEEHRYSFRLYALDAMLGLPEGSSKEQVERAMGGHVIAQTELEGRYRARLN